MQIPGLDFVTSNNGRATHFVLHLVSTRVLDAAATDFQAAITGRLDNSRSPADPPRLRNQSHDTDRVLALVSDTATEGTYDFATRSGERISSPPE